MPMAEGRSSRPEPPSPSDCCGSGCNPCILDAYADELSRWEQCQFSHHTTTSFTVALSASKFKPFPVMSITSAGSTAVLVRIALEKGRCLNLIPGSHIIMRLPRGDGDGGFISRPLTPVSKANTVGYFDLLVRIYDDGDISLPNKHGFFSKLVKYISVGDVVYCRGPFITPFKYEANMYQRLLMFCAGTGIAPVLQIVRSIVDDEMDETRVKIIYASRYANDILLKSEVDECNSFWNISLLHVICHDISANGESRTGQLRIDDPWVMGRVDSAIVRIAVGGTVDSTKAIICGNVRFERDVAELLLKEGLPPEHVVTSTNTKYSDRE